MYDSGVHWDRAYLAMSIALGASREDALGALVGVPPEPLTTALAASSRGARAKALAEELAVIARDLASLELRDPWGSP